MRITSARDQYEMAMPWHLALDLDPRARPPIPHRGIPTPQRAPETPAAPTAPEQAWVGADWRHAPDGGAFDSTVRPPLSSDIPHPKQLLDPHNVRHQAHLARAAASEDPENDPWGVLNGTGHTFEDLVNNHMDHHLNADPDQGFQGRVWYRAAHDVTKDLADKTTGDHPKAVATMSAFSPRKDWDENIEHGIHFLTHYNGQPDFDMPTMKGQISKAQRIYHGEDPHTVLGGPKTKAFASNILDPSNFRPARPGEDDDDGYYEHPANPVTGEADWRLHPDQETTVDTHHARAQVTPHGSDLNDLRYTTPPHFEAKSSIDGVPYHQGYDLHSRASWEATRRLNAAQDDPARHVTPKQSQANVWLKFKNDVDNRGDYRRNTPEPGTAPGTYDPEKKNWGLGPLKDPIPRYQRDQDSWEDPRRPREDLRQSPNWMRRSTISGESTWDRLLHGWIEQHYPHRSGVGQVLAYSAATLSDEERLWDSVQRVVAYSDSIIAATPGEEAFEHLQHNPGGITFRHHPGDAPTSGYMVSTPEAEKVQDYASLTPGDIDSYRDAHPEITEEPGNYYGGWEEDPDWYHDVSRNIDDSYDAGRAAVDWRQKAIFDNDKVGPSGPLDDSYIYTDKLVNSGPASATGFTHAKRRGK